VLELRGLPFQPFLRPQQGPGALLIRMGPAVTWPPWCTATHRSSGCLWKSTWTRPAAAKCIDPFVNVAWTSTSFIPVRMLTCVLLVIIATHCDFPLLLVAVRMPTSKWSSVPTGARAQCTWEQGKLKMRERSVCT